MLAVAKPPPCIMHREKALIHPLAMFPATWLKHVWLASNAAGWKTVRKSGVFYKESAFSDRHPVTGIHGAGGGDALATSIARNPGSLLYSGAALDGNV